MVEFANTLEVLGHFSTFVFRSVGFEIVRKGIDKQSHIAQVYDSRSKSTIFVTIIYLPNDEYIYTTSIENKQESNFSWTFKYDDYFKGLKLPTTDTELDSYYDNYKGDWANTFPGAITIRAAKLLQLNEDSTALKRHAQTPTQRFYSSVLVPTFKNYKSDTQYQELTEQDQISLSNKIKYKLFGISTSLRNIDDEFYPSKPTQTIMTKNTNTSSSLDLPKFDDEYEILKNKQTSYQPNVIPSIGDNDLNPLGTKYPSMKPYLDPLSDYNPSNSSGFNGMIPDKSHPLFTGNSGRLPAQRNIGDHPQGSRYDVPFVNDQSAELGLPTGSLRDSRFNQGGFRQGGFNQGGPGLGGFNQGGFF